MIAIRRQIETIKLMDDLFFSSDLEYGNKEDIFAQENIKEEQC